MTPRRLAGAALAAVTIVLAVVVFSGGKSPYVLHMRLDNSGGLRTGSDVTSGGVKIGQVDLHLGPGDQLVADLRIDRSHAPVGRDVAATISASNFLGRKRVDITPGNRRDPAPDGFVVATSRVTTSTDLDQVLNVLDADTRTRLSILIDEAGAAFAGRREDFSALLQQLPHSELKARQLLGELVADNHTLADTLTGSDRVLARVTDARHSLTRLVDVLGKATAPAAQRRAQLRATLAKAPGTLQTLQGFLGDLQRTTVPLGPAARSITASAPDLSATLAQLDPFRRAAAPTLKTATRVAPSLTRLAVGATPVLTQATPVAGQLATLSQSFVPVSDTLNHSVDNLLAIVQNWSRAIQFRDGLSHVFRGEALISPETIRSLVERLGLKLGAASPHAQSRHPAPTPAAKAPSRPSTPTPAPSPSPAPVRPPAVTLPSIGGTVQHLQQVISQLTGTPPPPPENKSAGGSLLDYLLKP